MLGMVIRKFGACHNKTKKVLLINQSSIVAMLTQTLTVVATVAVVFEQVDLYQFLILLSAGIILIVITSLVLLKEGSNDQS
jgi:hypothetical protein